MTAPEQCPYCHAEHTLEFLRSKTALIRVYECSCCSRQCDVDVEGEVVKTPDRRDAHGHVMYGD